MALYGLKFQLLSSKRYMLACASITDSDQPAHLPILTLVLDGHSMSSQRSNVSSGRKLGLWSDGANAQSDWFKILRTFKLVPYAWYWLKSWSVCKKFKVWEPNLTAELYKTEIHIFGVILEVVSPHLYTHQLFPWIASLVIVPQHLEMEWKGKRACNPINIW